MTQDPIAYNRLADMLRDQGVPTRYSGGVLRTQGICHGGDAPDTVAIKRSSNGVLIHCHKCGSNEGFLAELGLTKSALFDEPLPPRERSRPADDLWIPCRDRGKDKGGPGHKRIAQYLYEDERRIVEHGVTRCDHKCFAQWRPDPTAKSGRRWSLNDEHGNRLVRLLPFRLPELIEARNADRVIFVSEGEKDVLSLVDHGIPATCNAGGFGMGWQPEHAAFLEGADVTVVADRDEEGRKHAKQIVSTLTDTARSIYVVQAREGKDAYDHFAAGYQYDQFDQVWAPKPYPGDPAVTT